jgi:hypothetical protein
VPEHPLHRFDIRPCADRTGSRNRGNRPSELAVCGLARFRVLLSFHVHLEDLAQGLVDAMRVRLN